MQTKGPEISTLNWNKIDFPVIYRLPTYSEGRKHEWCDGVNSFSVVNLRLCHCICSTQVSFLRFGKEQYQRTCGKEGSCTSCELMKFKYVMAGSENKALALLLRTNLSHQQNRLLQECQQLCMICMQPLCMICM